MKRNKILNLGLIAGLVSTLLFIGGCVLADGEGGGFDWSWIFILVFFIGIFYFLMIRPQRKRQREQQELLQQIKKGERVIISGGIYGQIENVSEETVVLKLESGATMRVLKSGVMGKQQSK